MPAPDITRLDTDTAEMTARRAYEAAQPLIQPINRMLVGYGWHNEAYREYMRRQWRRAFTHYGADYWGEYTLWSIGTGEVWDAGVDTTFGGLVICRFPCVRNHRTGGVMDVVARYKHLARIDVVPGQRLDTTVLVGIMGRTGLYAGDTDHLHFEISYDYAHPNVEPDIRDTNMLICGDVDTTLDPADVLHTKPSDPDRQSSAPAWGSVPESDWRFPVV